MDPKVTTQEEDLVINIQPVWADDDWDNFNSEHTIV